MGFFPNPRLHKFLVDRICCAATMAVSASRYGRVGFGSASVSDMSKNRQREGGPIDQELGVIRIEDLAGNVTGALVNFTAHPVIMDSKNLLYSSEYPGKAMSVLEDGFGPGAVCLFANGACGDVTIHRSGPRFSEVDRVGRMLAGHALKTLEGVSTTEEARVGSSCSGLPLRLRDLPSVDEAKRHLEELSSRKPEGPEEVKALKKKLAKAAGTASLAQKAGHIQAMLGEGLTSELQVASINDGVLVGVPAELFVEYALSVKEEMKAAHTFVVGYCNDIVGYVVTPRAAEEGGYEAGSTLLDSEAGQQMVDKAKRMVSGD
jgi:hypothetical protein